MITNGPCITNTLVSLGEGVGSGKAMPSAALEKARAQSLLLLEQVLEAYGNEVALGEVGAGGSGRSSGAPPIAGRCPTGLLYGRIQSGKTLGMITLSALAIDNGFRVVVVLTSDNLKLVEQTSARFSALDGIVKDSTRIATWPADANHVRKNLDRVGLVVVCAKNQSHLASLVDFLEEIGASEYPALVLDDEADQATLDTTTSARSSGKPSAPKHGSTINRRTVTNTVEGELGRSVSEILRHFVFVQVTATPYALLLQSIDNPLRPRFTRLLQPGDGYTGGERFFSTEHLDDHLPPLVFVEEKETAELERLDLSKKGKAEEGHKLVPVGLAGALAFFLVAAGAQSVGVPGTAARPQNFLCHTSQKREEHGKLADLIRRYLDMVNDELRSTEVGGVARLHLEKAHTELLRTVPNAPALDTIFLDLRRRLPKRDVSIVNSDGDNADFKQGINFIVGGNILGRGLTIENLLVTYYLRTAKVSQMDTMLQHARMFGYREPIMPFTRVFLPKRLALRFHRIHTAEQNLRDLIADGESIERIPVEVGGELRPTRAGVLETGRILAYTPGQHLYPGQPLVSHDAAKKHEAARVATVSAGGTFPTGRGIYDPVSITLAQMAELLDVLPFDPADEDGWNPRALQGLLKSSEARFNGLGWLYCRQMKRESFTEGALSGAELSRLRAIGRPVLCVFLDTGHKYKSLNGEGCDYDFVYPTFLLPKLDIVGKQVPAHVFNVSE